MAQDLEALRAKLARVFSIMDAHRPTKPQPPIIDASPDASSVSPPETVPGFRFLKESIKRDLDAVEKFLSNPARDLLKPISTNAPYLLPVWEEVLCGPAPITAIFQTFPLEGSQANDNIQKKGAKRQKGEPGIKVDVVANGGKLWIRVDTVKNSRLLAEFREIDSYDTDSSDEEVSSSSEWLTRPSLAQKEFDNSLLRSGRALMAAASAHSNPPPRVVYRLPRLHSIRLKPIFASSEVEKQGNGDNSENDDFDNDPRIDQTIQMLIDMGLEVQLGERPDVLLSQESIHDLTPRPALRPTRSLNLDLSFLLALVSDITHAPLPTSVEEAKKRFVTPPEKATARREKGLDIPANISNDGKSENGLAQPPSAVAEEEDPGRLSQARALVNQTLNEMRKGILFDMHERLFSDEYESSTAIEKGEITFWTTSEAKKRCLDIVNIIGGPCERQRAEALFSSSDDAKETFWLGSRYPREYLPLLPVRLIDVDLDGCQIEPFSVGTTSGFHPFFTILSRTCQAILSEANFNQEDQASSLGGYDSQLHPQKSTSPTALAAASEVFTEKKRGLTAHTIRSLLSGAERGWTTLTANRSSVKAVMRVMIRASTNTPGGEWEWYAPMSKNKREENSLEKTIPAALWVIDPRSLAETLKNNCVMDVPCI